MSEGIELYTPRSSCSLSDDTGNTSLSVSRLKQEPPSPPDSPRQTTESSERVNAVLELFRASQKGARGDSWIVLELTPDDNETLRSILDRDKTLRGYVLDKLR